jgi:hypothetical protein
VPSNTSWVADRRPTRYWRYIGCALKNISLQSSLSISPSIFWTGYKRPYSRPICNTLVRETRSLGSSRLSIRSQTNIVPSLTWHGDWALRNSKYDTHRRILVTTLTVLLTHMAPMEKSGFLESLYVGRRDTISTVSTTPTPSRLQTVIA